ncbi:MAG: hypothetical protein U5L09_18275 [Bacteroidales bacterium]|nr:hypothetical protein [Bacteroidales bacterium]
MFGLFFFVKILCTFELTSYDSTLEMNNDFLTRLSLFFILLTGYIILLPLSATGQDQMPAPDNLQAVLDQDEGEPTQIHLTWEYDTELEGFQGFVIFQNGDTLNGNLTQSLSYTQTLYEEGTFIYQVQAMFEDSVFSEMSERKIISNFQDNYYDFGPGSSASDC